MPRVGVGVDVFETGVNRYLELVKQGHRIIISFSAGKDSGVSLELCVEAYKRAGRLIGYGGSEKVSVVMRDEEIMIPGTFEYAERVAARPEIDFHWIIAGQPITNVFNRASPYWWVFDNRLEPEQWVRQPPSIAYRIDSLNIQHICTAERFPPAPGKLSFNVVGLRAQESARRMFGTFSAGGHIIRSDDPEVRMWGLRPIYDWRDEDVWKAIADNKWDYNSAYDVLHKMGVAKRNLRIAPPTLNQAAVGQLQIAARAWPRWFDRVAKRLPGVRTAAQFGLRAVQPHRRYGETWEACFFRECINEAPANWIKERAMAVMEVKLRRHGQHATTVFPEVKRCSECTDNGSWKELAMNLYNGDPFCLKTNTTDIPYMEPDFFREGAGKWGDGAPTWK